MRALVVAASLAIVAPAAAQGGRVGAALAAERWPRAPWLDVATERVGAVAARRALGVSGQGAAVCVVDSGVDLRHDDFRDERGRTRVSWLLDLEGEPRGGDGAWLEDELGGAVLSAREIDRALEAGEPLPEDRHGHGTAVASVAVGDDAPAGASAPGPLAGVAPRASLVVVRALREGVPGFVDADLATGARFCARVGPPGRTVLVLGLGGHDGAHDGTEPLERALEALVDRGLPVVVAAGNDGGAPVHAGAALARGEELELPIFVPAPEGAPAERFVAVVAQTDASLSLVAPTGESTEWVPPGGRTERAHPGGRMVVDGSGRVGVVTLVASGGHEGGPPLRGGTYRLRARGPGLLDAWIAGADVGPVLRGPRFEGPLADATETVAVPGTTPAVITVGASVSRAELVTPGGRVAVDDADVGDVAPYSARGPARSGAPKPDLVAPGGWTLAALSSSVVAEDPHNLVGGSVPLFERLVVGDRIAVLGTSFAAPLVAGALSLAAEDAPLDPRRDAGLLSATAARADAVWDLRAGAGELSIDAFLSARAAAPGPAASGSLALTRATVRPRAFDVWAVARSLDTRGTPAGRLVTFRGSDGSAAVARSRGGVAVARLPLGSLRVGDTLTVRAEVDGLELGPVSVPVTVDERRSGIGAIGGGGCVVSAPGAARPHGSARLALGLLPLPLLLLRDRRSSAPSARSRRADRRPGAGSTCSSRSRGPDRSRARARAGRSPRADASAGR